jgi:hypothetical protein
MVGSLPVQLFVFVYVQLNLLTRDFTRRQRLVLSCIHRLPGESIVPWVSDMAEGSQIPVMNETGLIPLGVLLPCLPGRDACFLAKVFYIRPVTKLAEYLGSNPVE